MSDTEVLQESRLAAALAAFQKEIPAVVKGATAEVQTKAGGTYKYQYAPLEVITPLVLPLLGKHGLAWSAQPSLMGEMFVLHYSLMHESGEALEGIYPLPDPMSIKPQELGSAITYARRYALCAVTGVAPGGDDDDAASANDKPAAAKTRRAPQSQSRNTQPAPQPVQPASENWAARIVDVKTVDDLRLVHAAAVKAGELGRPLNPEFSTHLEGMVQLFGLDKPSGAVTVGQAISAVKTALEKREEEVLPLPGEDEYGPSGPSADDGPAAVLSWETATPGGDPS